MLLALLLLVSAPSYAEDFDAFDSQPHFFDEVCHVNRGGIASLDFHQTPAHPERVFVRVRWRDGSSTTARLENNERVSRREVLLVLKKHDGKQIEIGLRKERKGTMGTILGGDGTPFPVACFP